MRTLPETLTRISLPSGTVVIDGHGYLTDPSNWTIEFARFAAEKENITLTDRHLEVIDFIRREQADHGIIPDARFVFKYIGQDKGLNKSASKRVFFDLFPYGYAKQACKIAGMKQPRAWSTG